MADVSVRAAGPADVAEIARVQLVTWQTAYASILPARVLEGLTQVEVAAHWADAVETPPSPRHRVLVALEQDWVVGFAAVQPAEGPDAASAGLVTTLLVEPRWGRRGHGSRLLAATVDALREHGCQTALAWVLEPDRVSRGFYLSAGWEPDGMARALDMDGRLVTEVRLHTALGDD
ncbi:MAG: GNAT family N-acetyltransferase [Pseudonocardiales bacterium]|nr:MAG: GNAT family N-acetyltransferase [Pseudonocardiales bacterium]